MFNPTSFENKDHIQEEFTSLEEVAEKSMSTSNDSEDKLDDKLENFFVPFVWPSVGFWLLIYLFVFKWKPTKL